MNDVLVVGVGGAGCDIAQHVHATIGGRAVAINTDGKALSKSLFTERLLIGPKLCGTNGANTPQRARRAVEESSEELLALFAGARSLILSAGLGGATGTGAVPIIAQLALAQGLEVWAAVTLPFVFERSRREVALAGLAELRATGAKVIVHDHAEISEIVDTEINLGLTEVLDRAGRALAIDLYDQFTQCNLSKMGV